MFIANYALKATAVVQLRGANFVDLPERIYLGLLCTPPRPEGSGYCEIDHPNYARQLINVSAVTPMRPVFRTRSAAEFGPIGDDWPTPTHGAIFDEDNNLLFYGVFERRTPYRGSYKIAFRPGAVELRA